MSGAFTFNGKSSASLGLLVNNVTNFGAPSRVVEKIQVPYRNGDLLIDTGTYNNYMVSYDVALINNVVVDTREIAEWLLAPKGYAQLTDTYNTGEFRMAAYYNQIDYTMAHLNRYGRATISFDCKPQRFLDSGQTAINITTISLTNSTGMAARPLIELTGNGTCTINDYSITITDNAGETTIIDCESMQCYNGTINMNNSVTMPNGFPILDKKYNACSKGSIGTVKLTPRWWRL